MFFFSSTNQNWDTSAFQVFDKNKHFTFFYYSHILSFWFFIVQNIWIESCFVFVQGFVHVLGRYVCDCRTLIKLIICNTKYLQNFKRRLFSGNDFLFLNIRAIHRGGRKGDGWTAYQIFVAVRM